MNLTEALYDRLTGDATLTALLATYNGDPAVFTTDPAPGDAELPYIVTAGHVSDEPFDTISFTAEGDGDRFRLDNVSIKLGEPDDPRLPANSFDRIFMVHMYHEVGEPYAFLWRLRPALRPGGRVIVVDVDRPTDQHGIDPRLLFCEFASVGFRLVEFVRKPELAGYYAQFEVSGNRPDPQDIDPCSSPGNNEQAPVQ